MGTAWKTTALENLVQSIKTWNPLKSPSGDTFVYIDLSAVDQETKQIIGAREVVCGEAPSRARQLVSGNDVLVATVRPNLNGVARVPNDLDGATASTGFCVLRPQPTILESGYLFHWVKSPPFVNDMVRKATGASYPAVSDKIIFQSQIPLPPLPDQKRIADILDRADALRAKRRAALAELDSLTQAMFVDLFGDPDTNPKNWASESVAELCAPRAYGCVGGPFGSDLTQADYVEFPGVPVIRGQNLSTNSPFLDEDGFVFVSEAKAKALSRNGALRGDILVSQRGARLAGQVALIPSHSQFENYIVSQSQMRISPDLNKVDPLYLVYYFRSPRAVRRMEARTISTGVPHINLGILREFLVEIPPISLQREFANRVNAVEKLKTVQRASLVELDALFAALQHRAFRGEL
jgi:type I restriction enzyme S subunit